MRRKGKKELSRDERELWSKVARTARPMHKPKPIAEMRTPGAERPHAPPVEKEDVYKTPLKGFRVGERSQTVPAPHHAGEDLSNRIAHAPVRMDHGTHRKMMRGKLKPQARIDLHGMTLAQAHPALVHFVIDSFDAGHRLVLVITGKGRGGSDHDGGGPIPIRRGVLRQQVPGWLHAPPLGAMVLDIREAHQRHGGGGAYYVYLKRRG